MHDSPFVALFVVFVAGMIGSEIAQRLKLPSVVGQIAAGVAVGPSALGWVRLNDSLEMLSEIGAVLLLLSVGLETRLHDLRKIGPVALRVGVMGVVIPFVAGGAWAYATGFHDARAAFVAAAFVATSAGITARVLQEMGVLDRMESRIILGAAVIDDILAMLVLAIVTALQGEKGVDVVNLVKTFAHALGFVLIVAFFGTRVMRRAGRYFEEPMDAESPLTIAVAICLGLAAVATNVGLAAIIGAFLAGMVLAETDHRHYLETNLKPLVSFVVPFFFVMTGAKVSLRELADPNVIVSVVVVTILAVTSKFLGGYLGARSLGRHEAKVIGIGMVPRGEVGIIVASLGQRQGVFDGRIYAIVIAMSLLTSVVAPPMLGRALRTPTINP